MPSGGTFASRSAARSHASGEVSTNRGRLRSDLLHRAAQLDRIHPQHMAPESDVDVAEKIDPLTDRSGRTTFVAHCSSFRPSGMDVIAPAADRFQARVASAGTMSYGATLASELSSRSRAQQRALTRHLRGIVRAVLSHSKR